MNWMTVAMQLGDRIVYMVSNGHRGIIIALNNGLCVLDCEICGYAHIDPLPEQSAVNAYYEQDEFYRTHGPKGWLANEWVENTNGLWDSAYEYQSRLLRHYGAQSLVDVGCGTGWFIEYYSRMHFALAAGIEPSMIARGWSSIMVEDAIYPDYDSLLEDGWQKSHTSSLRMALVMEHVLNPRAVLVDSINRYVGHDGVVMLIVPNEFNPLQRKLVRRIGYDWYVQKPHINYFSKDSLRDLVESSGLRVVHQSGTFPIELYHLLGWHYIGNETIGQKCHRNRLHFERKAGIIAWKTYELLYKLLGWGRESILVAKRY